MQLNDSTLVGLIKNYQKLQETGQFWDGKFQKLGELIADELGDSYDIQRTITYVQGEVFRRYLLLMEMNGLVHKEQGEGPGVELYIGNGKYIPDERV